MVIILPKVESTAEQVGRALSSGLEKGMSRSMDFKQQIALERARRGLDVESQLGALSPETRGLITGKAQQGMPSRGVPSQGMPSQGMQYGEISPEDKRYTPDSEMQQMGMLQRKRTAIEKEYEVARRVNEARQLGYQPNLEAIKNKIEEEERNLETQREEEKKLRELSDAQLTSFFGKNNVPSPEELNLFYNKAQAYRNQNLSNEQIKSRLFKDMKTFVNQKSSIKKLPKYENTLRKAYRSAQEERKSEEDLNTQVRAAIKPLLDQGLIEEVRTILGNDLGYNKEAVESFVSNLGDIAKRELSTIPKTTDQNIEAMKAIQKGAAKLDPTQMISSLLTKTSQPTKASLLPKLQETVRSILAKDPNTNIILLRKEMMDRGMSWSDFGNEINNLIMSGEYRYPSDQENATDVLTQPPLNFLDKILYTIGMKGK